MFKYNFDVNAMSIPGNFKILSQLLHSVFYHTLWHWVFQVKIFRIGCLFLMGTGKTHSSIRPFHYPIDMVLML